MCSKLGRIQFPPSSGEEPKCAGVLGVGRSHQPLCGVEAAKRDAPEQRVELLNSYVKFWVGCGYCCEVNRKFIGLFREGAA